MLRATPARDIGDLVKLSSLTADQSAQLKERRRRNATEQSHNVHAQFKRKTRATIIELQEEQEQIESQKAKYQTFQEQVQGPSCRSRLGMDGPNNMRLLILQEIT